MTESASNEFPTTPLQPEAFAPFVKPTEAALLVRYGIAPLVAAARGYRTLDRLSVPDLAKSEGLGSITSKGHRAVLDMVRTDSALILPWYRVDLVTAAQSAGQTPAPTTTQLRSSSSSSGSPSTMMLGSDLVMDVHPATPPGWCAASPTLLVTKGVLNGDRALTSLLRAHLIDDEVLATGADISPAEAIRTLHALMLGIRPSDRVTVLAVVDSARPPSSEVWEVMQLAGREMILALGGNESSDWNAWSRSNDLWTSGESRNAVMKIVGVESKDPQTQPRETRPSALPQISGDPDSGDHALGSEVLSEGGLVWSDLLSSAVPRMPEAPARTRGATEIGAWRVSLDGCGVQQLCRRENLFGHASSPEWEDRIAIGGQVIAMETHRAPTELEVSTGRFGAGVNKDTPFGPSTCRIRLQWLREDFTIDSADVTGPATLLMYPPEHWDRRGAYVPNNLLQHPAWPPHGARGHEWLRAIKANQSIATAEILVWDTMGWVPVEASPICAFISGGTVIARNVTDRDRTHAGVTNTVLPGASGFALPDSPHPVMSEMWKEQVRNDLRSLRETYIENAPWRDRNVAALVMAAGMRPSVPSPCTTVIWFQGASGSGKSFTVSQILSFHQRGPIWTDKHLPGAIRDTATGSEQAVAQTNIWVLDDLAPTQEGQKYRAEEDKAGTLVRSVHGNFGKRRSGIDLKAREVFTPHALLVLTAENEHSISSVRDRTIIVNLSINSLVNDAARDRLERFRDNNRAPGRLLAAAAQAFQYVAERDSWPNMLGILTGETPEAVGAEGAGNAAQSFKTRYERLAKDRISRAVSGGKPDVRHREMAVDLMLGLAPLSILAEMVGDSEMSGLLDPERSDGLPARIASFAVSSFEAQAESTPVIALLGAIRETLAAGHAHILNPQNPSQPPLPISDRFGNNALGWRTDPDGKMQPLGRSIGYLKANRGGPLNIVMLNRQNAFDEAQRHYPKALPPGTSVSTAFIALWDEGLTLSTSAAQKRDARGDVIFKVGGRTLRGVPVGLDSIIGASKSAAGRDGDY
ncbi:hypothetical protein [Cryobacterium sp. GrIS_2_6]|uniref:hypothetical protein n=1 Tax=Cryobacterium sp. GrIS_2_6 TaxID=3162785 RepID=UPI002DF889C2|nr:hypothetical protein [Cryobacterium psychrotolerans]